MRCVGSVLISLNTRGEAADACRAAIAEPHKVNLSLQEGSLWLAESPTGTSTWEPSAVLHCQLTQDSSLNMILKHPKKPRASGTEILDQLVAKVVLKPKFTLYLRAYFLELCSQHSLWNCTSRAFFSCRLAVLSPKFYRKGTEVQGETCSRPEWADAIEMEKAQKLCGKDESDLYRRTWMTVIYTHIYTKPEMKTQCQGIHIIISFYS